MTTPSNSNPHDSTGFRTAFDTVQDTLNNVKIAEIEKRMVQLANSFNGSPTNFNVEQTNSPKKVTTNGNSSKIAFASKSEIAATYMARSSAQSNSPPTTTTKTDQQQQSLPPNLRLNDDILSVHFNNVTSNVKKRHSLSDPADSLIKYLSANVSTTSSNVPSTPSIQVRDDSILTDTKISPVPPTIVAYENLLDLQSNLQRLEIEEEQKHDDDGEENRSDDQSIRIDTIVSDSESDIEHSDGQESAVSSPTTITTITTTNLNLKSLLKTPTTPKNLTRRVMFDPLALLLDAAVVGELQLVIKAAKDVRLVFYFHLEF